jgi:hypothetical protein
VHARQSFGDTKAAGWLAKDRSDKFRGVDNERKHPGSLPEADALVRWLDDALPPCKDRNLLVHEFGGHSTSMLAHSKFIPCAFEITNRAAAPLRSINSVTRGSFKDVEVELWKLQTAIEARLPPEPEPCDSE